MATVNADYQKPEPVQTYLTKPLIAETIVTVDKPQRTLYKPTQSSITRLYVDYTNNCVMWAKAQTGIYRTMGYGGMSAVQGREPRVGAIGVLYGHAVVTESIDGNMITFEESNYIKNWITRRTLPLSSFLGFIYW